MSALDSRTEPVAPATGTPKPRRARAGLLRSLLANRKALFGAVVLVLFALLALLAPLLAPGDPSKINSLGASAPSGSHLLGTTAKGQDVLALTLWGARSSLLVGFCVGLAATALAVLVGMACAYFGRIVDDVLSLVTNIFLLVPGVPLLVILAAFMPPGTATVVLVLVVTGWAAPPGCCAPRPSRSAARTSSPRPLSPVNARSGSCSGRSCPTWHRSS